MPGYVNNVAGWVDAPEPGEPATSRTDALACGDWADGASRIVDTWMLPVESSGQNAALDRIRAGATARGHEIRSDHAAAGDARGILQIVDPRTSYDIRIRPRSTSPDPSLSDWLVVEVGSLCHTRAPREW
ncbi:hypothetical protein [Streptomyces sp. SID3343]|uniref:hypothetical protein n=1 Tax=Streptomyces sp. SID3343 TaxID=2690260 RepID=UPI00137224CB|nr:hypothetical protein [Streptomyces sp. SID3343]MYV96755.1 hypothetical protein [Streptomyces sp. SID3343]